MAGFNFLSGMPSSLQMPQLQQAAYTPQMPIWMNPYASMQPQAYFMPGEQGGIPAYTQNPLSNQGAAGFSLGDRLQRLKSAMGEQNINLGLGGLQMMLNGWGSRS